MVFNFASSCPRLRNSSAVSTSIDGELSPQSLAELTQIIEGPYISRMSTARCGVTFVTGYNRQPRPESRITGHANRVLFAVVDQHPVGPDSRIIF